MRVLVLSDTHRDRYALREALLRQPKAEVLIHLGDGAEEAQELCAGLPGKAFYQVRGNCDWGSLLPAVGELCLEGRHIFYTHGHLYEVKYGLSNLVAAAEERGAQIALFGHTHRVFYDKHNRIAYMNPGSIGQPPYGIPPSYGILQVDGSSNTIATDVIYLEENN